MTAKLIKVDTGWVLMVDNIMYATDNDKLSLKNCQAIERGYDLDDCVDYFEKGKLYIQQDGVIILAGENGNNGIIIQDPLKTRGVGHYSDEWNPKAFCEFKQEALEILGDKKFSEDDLMEAYSRGQTNSPIQSLQKTEWDVTVEMEYVGECNGNNDEGCFQDSPGHNCGCFERRPKLDADGCLILKTFKSE